MARRKKASSRRTRGKKQQYRLMDNLLGIIVCLLMLVGLFNLGVLGTFLDNCFKIFVGSSFPIAMIIVFSLWIMFCIVWASSAFQKTLDCRSYYCLHWFINVASDSNVSASESSCKGNRNYLE